VRIGIDLDSTLIKLPVYDIVSQEFSQDVKEEHNKDWYLTVFPDQIRHRIYQLFADPVAMCEKVEPLEGAYNKLVEWCLDEGHDIILITARSLAIGKQTLSMVNRFFPMIKDVNLVGLGSSKESVFKSKFIDVWIDDNPYDIIMARDLGIKTILISNKYTKYNHHIRDRVEWVKAVKDINL
jgi:uncharacterized HAD superfamily protein